MIGHRFITLAVAIGLAPFIAGVLLIMDRIVAGIVQCVIFDCLPGGIL